MAEPERDPAGSPKIPIRGEPPPTRAKPVDAPAKNPAMLPGEVPVPVADGAQEYVAGGHRGTVYPNTYHALGQKIDDATNEFGQQLYEVMLRDSTTGGAFELLKQSVMEGGIKLLPAVLPRPGTLPSDLTQDPNPDVPLAQEIADFCTWCLGRLPRPLEDCLYELLDGMAFGNKLAEQVYEVCRYGPHRAKTCLARLDVKPAWSWAFVIDPYSAVLGILGAVPGQAGLPLGIVGAEGQVSGSGVLLPRDKFCIFTWMSKDGDPRGSSQLRRAVNGWNEKIRAMPRFGNYLDRFAQDSLFATVPDGAKSQAPIDSAGNVIPGAKLIPATSFLFQQMVAFKGGSAMVGPAGTEMKVISPSGNGEAFRFAIELFKKEIVFAILQTTRGILEAEHGSKADAEVGQDVQSVVIKYAKGVLARMIQREILRPLVRLNWGDEAADRLLPQVTVGGVEAHDFAKDAGAVAALMSANYFAPSQLRGVDAKLNLPIREEPPEDVLTGEDDAETAEEERPGPVAKPATDSTKAAPAKPAPGKPPAPKSPPTKKAAA